jgi:hypothetical protein
MYVLCIKDQFLTTVLILLHCPHTRIKRKLRNIKHPEHHAQLHMKNLCGSHVVNTNNINHKTQ